MKKKYTKSVLFLLSFFGSIMLSGCTAYTNEQLIERESIKDIAKQNAVSYIESKYNFTATVDSVELEDESTNDFTKLSPDATGKAYVTMSYEDESFLVYINGLGDDWESFSYDNYQYTDIRESLIERLDCYDIYLNYGYSHGDDTGLVHDYFSGKNYSDVVIDNSEAEFVFIKRSVKNFDIDKCKELGISRGVAINFVSRGAFNSLSNKSFALGSENDFNLDNKLILINDYKTYYSYKDGEYIDCSKAEFNDIIFSDSSVKVTKGSKFSLGTLKDIYKTIGKSYNISTNEDSLSIFVPKDKFNSTERPYLVYSYTDKSGKECYSASVMDKLDGGKYLTTNIKTDDRYNIKIAIAEREVEEEK